MKEIVVISGKGGTGKTSIASSFVYLGGTRLVAGDCDVDADDMHLLLQPDFAAEEAFSSGYLAGLNSRKCTACGKCFDVCRFHAVLNVADSYRINEIDCEGCGYCYEVCPNDAITMKEATVGRVFESVIKTGGVMVHARLRAGADNSGKLVARVKQKARLAAERLGLDMILIDGSPGTGCPVVSSLTGADYVILVTEPTASGVHDLKRVYELVKKFRISTGLIINKYDINSEFTAELERFAADEQIKLISSIPYNEDFTRAITAGMTAVEYSENAAAILKSSWETVIQDIEKE